MILKRLETTQGVSSHPFMPMQGVNKKGENHEE